MGCVVIGLNDYRFEDYLLEANRAESVDSLFSILTKAAGKHGLNRCVFGMMTDHLDIGKKAGFGIACSYPDDWVQYYNEKNFRYIDPVIMLGSIRAEPFLWSRLNDFMNLSKTQRDFLLLAEEAGLRNGLCVPLHGLNHQIAGVGLATTEKKDAFDRNVDLVAAYCSHFYVAYKRLMRRNADVVHIQLTNKEREVLTWAAAGKTDAEIAFILNMSRNTVDAHMRKIFSKLGANSRVLAAVKAISLGLINV
ncbi:bacterial regulatory s, luxR family protein [Micavibrio aeruginosavorus ARL-13]|uniref:Bacterial regulatory s, luxR family protein n=1 Tax=Micavibrio aeruginosavorus (strain ARL-13) TaxID=856793 RepID=G2KQ93_MICAA|nr:bacterial regulatory s, luxR family protein [Micavibrio aeruginosavorus ARL-13]